jgi:hypothetical protein
MPICGWFLGCKFAQQLELGEVKALADRGPYVRY